MTEQPNSSLPGDLRIHASRDSGQVVLALEGELDLASAPKLEEELQRAEAENPSLLRIDLSGLTFMDSTGMRTLLLAQRRAQEGERRLALRRGPNQVQRVFELTGSVDTFAFED